MSEPHHTPRRRRLSVFMLALLTLVLAALVVREAWDYHEARRLEATVSAIRTKGEPVTEFDIARARAGSGEVWREEGNEAARYYAAAAALARSPTEADGGYRTTNVCTSNRLASDSRPLDAQVAALRHYVGTHADTIGLLQRATALPFRHFGPGTEYSYRMSQLSTLAKLSSTATCAHIVDGDPGQAAESVLATVRMMRVPGSMAFVGEYSRVFDDVVRLVERTRPSDAALTRLQEGLREATIEDDVERSLVRDRVQLLTNVQRHFSGAGRIAPVPAGPFQSALTDYVFRPWNRRGLIGLLRTLSAMVDSARQPWPAKLAAIEAVGDRQLLPGWSASPRTGANELVWDYKRRARDGARRILTTRATMVAVAIVRYRTATGTLPGTLADLVPTHLNEKPVDLLTGQDMRYVRQADGFAVYSVGADGKDDGGQVAGERPANLRERRLEDPKDWGVRVRRLD